MGKKGLRYKMPKPKMPKMKVVEDELTVKIPPGAPVIEYKVKRKKKA